MPPTPPDNSAASAAHAGRVALGVLALTVLLNFISRGMLESFATFLLPLSDAFDWSRTQVTSLYAVSAFITGVASPLVGVLFDRWGPRNLYMLGLAAMVLGLGGAAMSNSLWQFQFCFGVLVGFASLALGPIPNAALVSRWFRERYTTAIGVLHAAQGLGIFAIAPISQLLIDGVGWRGAYGAMAGAIVLVAGLLMLAPWRRVVDGHYPPASAAAWRGGIDWTLGQAVKSVPFWCFVWTFLVTSIANFAVVPHTVAIFVESGLEPLRAASLFGTLGLTALVGVLGYARIADWIGVFPTAMITFAGTSIGLVSLLLFHQTGDMIWMYGYLAAFGPSMGSRFPLISNFANKVFGGPRLASIFGSAATALGVGAAIGALGSGLLHDWSGDYGATLIWAIVFSVLSPLGFVGLRLRGVK